MALWTEEQRIRWLTARQVLADLIEERGCKVREAASARGASQRVVTLEAECSALIDLRHGLTMADEDLIDGILTGATNYWSLPNVAGLGPRRKGPS
jgi:hypothetical protein